MHETWSVYGLAKMVKEMRDLQREFFSPGMRKPDTLVRAKTLEKMVDAAVREVLEPGLFGEEQ